MGVPGNPISMRTCGKMGSTPAASALDNLQTTKGVKRKAERKTLTLQQRVELINRHEENPKLMGSRYLAISFGVGKTQVNSILKNKDAILAEWKSGGRSDRKYLKARRTPYANLNKLLWDWFCKARSKNIPVSGPILQEKALIFAIEMGHDDFSASNGWLQSFRQHYNISYAALSGEAAEVKEETVTDWHKRLPTICQGYNPCDIFNADETGLKFFTELCLSVPLLRKEMTAKEERNRRTVSLCCLAQVPLVSASSHSSLVVHRIQGASRGMRWQASQ